MTRTAIINNWWINLNPAKRMDARYWIHVSASLVEAGIDPEQATAEQVRTAITATENKITAAQELVTAKYAEAAVLQNQARTLKQEVDALPTSTGKGGKYHA